MHTPKRFGHRNLIWLIVFAAVAGAIVFGLPIKAGLRRWVFDESAPVRFREDARRGFFWGRQTLDHGFITVYEAMKDQPPEADIWLDYAPLRLAVMTFWAKANSVRLPGVREYQNTFEFAALVLWVNTAVELWGAVGMFLLVRHWVIRRRYLTPDQSLLDESRGVIRPLPSANQILRAAYPMEGVAAGLVAAMLLWLNPAMLLSGYAWPTWDLWVVAFFIWAIYLACIDWWFTAGAVLALGAMFKGQQLAVACIFVIWPLASGSPRSMLRLFVIALIGLAVRFFFAEPAGAVGRMIGAIGGVVAVLCAAGVIALAVLRGRWRPVLRWASGFVFAVALVVAGWMLRHAGSGGWNLSAILWIAAVALTIPIAAIGAHVTRRSATHPNKLMNLLLRPWAMAAMLFLIILICSMAAARGFHWQALVLAGGVAACVALLPLRKQAYVWAVGVSFALLLCMPMFHASSAWYECGWKYGAKHFQRLIVGRPNNVPALLVGRYGFNNDSDYLHPVFTIPARMQFGLPSEPYVVTLKTFMVGLFVALMLPCAIAAGGHAARNDRRFLVAIVTPWLLFFLFPLQIHERYLLFAAGVAACMVAVGFGMTLLHVFLSFASFTMILNVLENPGRRAGYAWEYPESIFIQYGELLRNICSNMHPGMAWALLLCAGIFLYVALTRSQPSTPEMPAKSDEPRTLVAAS